MPQIRAYEHTNGEKGRSINYRAPRYQARELFAGPFPVAVIAGAPHSLCDVSRTGLSAIGQGGSQTIGESGATVPFVLRIGDAALIDGEAAVARVEGTELGPKVGLKFLRHQVDLDAVVHSYQRELLRARLAANFSPVDELPPASFRLVCADILGALRAARDVLEHWTGASTAIDESFLGECLETLWAALSPLAEAANAALEAVLEDPPKLGAHKRYAERVLTPEFIAAPLWRRAFGKPLGYPADYVLIQRLDSFGDRSLAPFVQLLEELGRRTFGWLPRRSQMIADALVREAGQQRAASPLRIVDVGCGYAGEAIALVERLRAARPIALTLVDPDAAALEHTLSRLNEDILRAGGRLQVSGRHAAYTQLLEGGELQGKLAGAHIIVAPALLDYLRHRAAIQLLDALHDCLVPGGLIIAGCVRRHPSSARWASELICDWSMIHRERDEVSALAVGLPKAKVDVRLDRDRDLYLLTIRRSRATAATSR